jgi:hypothetical protein
MVPALERRQQRVFPLFFIHTGKASILVILELVSMLINGHA